mmetsp:Transcript_39206/g.28957  ORF Transcript_39206/g.28957 Transcript_39206/m.28957 type:complete len:117 (-) Transcript_39206:60-410(-)
MASRRQEMGITDSVPNMAGANRIQGAGVRESVEITVNNNITRSNTVLAVNVNDTVGSLVAQIRRDHRQGQISIDFAGTNLVTVADQNKTLAELGITPGSTLDIMADNGLVGGSRNA